MKFDLYKYAMEWVTEVGRELEGITTEEVMEEVNANLPNETVWDDEQLKEIETTYDPITMDEADTIRRIIEERLAK